MKKFYFSTLFVFTFCFGAWAQCPPDNDIRFTSQQELDDFAINYPNCTQLFGSVRIGTSNTPSDINDLSPLSSFTIISGVLEINNNPLLMNLNGLESLFYIGEILIKNNDVLSSLDGLQSLTNVIVITILSNAMLIDITGLENVNYTAINYVRIEDNPVLSVCSLPNLCNYLNDSGGAFIEDNASNCSSIYALLSNCDISFECPFFDELVVKTQSDVDSFPIKYPNCNTLERLVIGSFQFPDSITDLSPLNQLTTVNGDLRISHTNVSDLQGLSNLSYLGGNLSLSQNDALVNLNGLENLSSLEGNLGLSQNDALVNLSGLENLSYLGGNLSLSLNNALVNLDGLQNLTAIEEMLYIQQNDALVSLSGLDNITIVRGAIRIILNDALSDLSSLNQLTTINGDLIINYTNISDLQGLGNLNHLGESLSLVGNNALVNLNGLENLTSIEEGLNIQDNDALINLSGLDNITIVRSGINIIRNNALTDFSGLDNLTSTGSVLVVRNNNAIVNFNGLESLTSLGTFLDISNNNALATMEGLGNLETVGHGVRIYENPVLENLDGLESLTSIERELSVIDNPVLNNINGLESLVSIGSFMQINNNDALVDLRGLESLTTIGGFTEIGLNDTLQTLEGLENLVSIDGFLNIQSNPMLTELNGLANIDYNTIDSMKIMDNDNLSICYVESVCNYLADGRIATINSNDSGCNSPSEVQASCIALPVELTRFTAEAQRGSVLLKWQTASETNNQGFEIQRSKDGINWEKIGYQQGADNSNTTQDYRYNDTQPLSGINYYRLLQMDIEGDVTYSDIVNVIYESRGFSVFPVPAKDEITLQIESPQTTVQIRISNMIGEVIHMQDLQLSEGVNQVRFDISAYTNGVYSLTVDKGGKKGTQRFVRLKK